MAIMIREYAGYDKFDVEFNYPMDKQLQEADNLTPDPLSADSLMVDIEGIHAFPHATRNFTRYMPECLKGSIPTWTKPYRRPQIKHHNEKDGEIIGRIQYVDYVTTKTLSGTPALVFTVNIPDKQAMQEVQDGRLETVSIGVIAHDVRCSICGHQIAEEGPCPDHDRGQVYDGEVCYWDIYQMEAKELSYVIVPSDIYAKNIHIYRPTAKQTVLTEKLHGGGYLMNEKDQKIAELQEQFDKLTAEVTTLTEAKTALEGQVATLSEEKTSLEAKITELTEANANLTATNTELTEGKTSVESELAQEKQLKEGLEDQIIALKTELKTTLQETVQAMRKAAGKTELAEDIIAGRSEESLRDSINDLKEEFKTPLPTPGSVKSPALAEKIDENNESNVKEKNSTSNIDLAEELENIFTSIIGKH